MRELASNDDGKCILVVSRGLSPEICPKTAHGLVAERDCRAKTRYGVWDQWWRLNSYGLPSMVWMLANRNMEMIKSSEICKCTYEKYRKCQADDQCAESWKTGSVHNGPWSVVNK